MAEWSIAQPWKGCERLRVPRVRIPVCPPFNRLKQLFLNNIK